MVKPPKVATKSSKRYRYSSFKDKIDNLRIEPARDLSKRVHDHVETSHFLASFEHWEDINLSAGFTSFTDDVRPLVQTLPQLLFHEDQVFDHLHDKISLHDEHSLQPLLDLLSQFCHDLGPDFMKFYEKAMRMLTNLLDAAIQFESSNVFEWVFNCVAYIYKYLSRILAQDLLPTFNLLFPILSHRKEYLSRFSAEVLSFLVRKTKQKSLEHFVNNTFEQLRGAEDESIYDGLRVLYTEALISKGESLHSKFELMMGVLIRAALQSTGNPSCISLMADVILNIVRHASIENASQVYDITLAAIDAYLDDSSVNVNCTVRLLTSLSFAESGKKTSSWSNLIASVNKVVGHPNADTIAPEDLALLFCFILRNAALPDLAQCHRLFFSIYLEKFTDDFLGFFRLALKYDKDRVLSFGGAKSLQRFINMSWRTQSKKIALFFVELGKEQSLLKILNPSIPKECAQSLLSEITQSEMTKSDSLYDLFWKLQLLKFDDSYNLSALEPIVSMLLEKHHLDDFEKDVIGMVLQSLTVQNNDQLIGILKSAFLNVEKVRNSRLCLEGIRRIVDLIISSDDKVLYQGDQQVLIILANNLSLPEDKIRYETIKLIIKVMELQGQEIPQIFSDCRLIEEIPRNLQTARDVTMRLKAAGDDFARSPPDVLLCHFFLHYLFGSLTVRFSPAWEGVYQILPNVFEKDQQLTWRLFLEFMDALDSNFRLEYYTPHSELDVPKEIGWSVSVTRLNDALLGCKEIFESYSLVDLSLVNLSKEARSDLTYPGLIRNQALRGLLLVPQLAERHSRDIVPYFLKTDHASSELTEEIIERESSAPNTWSEDDRKLLLQLMGKFKNIKAIFRSEDVYSRFMDLLGSRTTEIQKMALDGLLAYKEKAVTKYRDNLKNLLDDNAFKDECLNLLSNNEKPIVDADDGTSVMPIVLRILFGRAQTPVTSGLKKSRKTAVITLLPSLAERYVVDFLKLASQGLNYQTFFQDGLSLDPAEISSLSLRRMTGFVTLGQAAVSALGSRYPNATTVLINPVLYAIYASNVVSSGKTEKDYMLKQATNVRQLSMKLILNVFSSVGDYVDWTEQVPKFHKLIVEPRLPNFADENLQKPSALLTLISLWATNTRFYKFLYYQQCSIAGALMELLSRCNAKESVLTMVLSFSNQLIKNPTEESEYVDLVSLVASSCLRTLPKILNVSNSQETVTISLDLLLNLIDAGYVHDNETKKYLINSLACILDEGLKGIRKSDAVKVMQSISFLLEDYTCEWNEIESLYKSCSKLYRTSPDKELRMSVNAVFQAMARIFEGLQRVANLLSDLNAYSIKRMETYDFETVLPTFKKLDGGDCMLLNETEWIPVLNTCLYYIRNEEELALRTNASHTLKRFMDFVNAKPSIDDARAAVELVTADLLPEIKIGLRHKNADVQAEFVSITAYIIGHSKYYGELDDMKVLLYEGDDEANFFTNVVHIQLHRRQRAIKRLGESASNLAADSIAHFLIPMIERYVYCTDEKYRNICNEAISAIGLLSHFVTWSQYKALMRRFISSFESKPQFLKEIVSLVVHCSKALSLSMDAVRNPEGRTVTIKKLPITLSDPETFVKEEIFPKLMKILNTRDEETIVARIPLCEALVNFTLGLDVDERSRLLPGVLSSVCQVLRSRSEELREAVRKNLASVSVILGHEYLTFILKELKSALRRGSQIHILSYTIHSILSALSAKLNPKDLDSTAKLIVDVIMEDTFGTAGQEKDAEGYTSKLKEIKFNKSYDTAEIISSNISLASFVHLLHPIKALLTENLGLKNQRKLNELMRRYSLGLNHNVASASTDALVLCYEIFTQSTAEVQDAASGRRRQKHSTFFLVNLNARNDKVQTELKSNNSILRKFALDLLKTILMRNVSLLEAAYLENFTPLLQEALEADEEEVLISTLRVLIILVKLKFTEKHEGIFKNCARKVLTVIRDSPSTSSELCQVSLKFLSSLIRHKDIELKDTALSYILGRIKPDLNEPNKQGLAFNFIKSLVLKHIVLPELYDVVDAIAEIMVTNHSKEIRDVSRSVYYQFLMEYDQSRGRLEKQFKFLVSNLEYPSQEGRQSVMELINLIVSKSGMELLLRISSSFFLSLSNVAANDTSPRCREMGTALLKNLLARLGQSNVSPLEKYIMAWLKHDDSIFVELGLKIYKIHMDALAFSDDNRLDSFAISKAKRIVSGSTVGSTVEWNLIYTALNVLNTYVEIEQDKVIIEDSDMWSSTVDSLLYPHPWVRLISSKMVKKYIQKKEDSGSSLPAYEFQKIAYRLFHQLGAPSVSESLASTAVSILVVVLRKWIAEKTAFITKENEDVKYDTAVQFALARIGSVLRDEENLRETFVSKKASIQLFGLIVGMMDETELKSVAAVIILPLFMYLEDDRRIVDEQAQELQTLSQECLELLQNRLSVSDFSFAYSNVKQEITRRRNERRAKRAALAVTAPEAAARRKLRKHARSKEKRRHEKDDSGFYRAKNKKSRI
ncbi:Utp20p LALA0_S09e06238g [Lachancea lanzarotensis]|uniref:LALA0S09e06238g1_1 n=1 Tax=Lachancea lanzarotensis TaxID=1245769 RepID=A0A0C7NE13_9SACH|nr:uncharacterized protein LALA0_S09e06238g [Lachancea lanzarotensis]CEP63954.1 LALA0S09e06238g1_1 [Lachancea lanzarotensis]